MPALFWIDVAGLAACALGSLTLGLFVLSLGPGRIINRWFVAFALANAAWVFFTLLLRLSLWLNLWDPQLLLELATLALCLAGPTLLLFARRYTRSDARFLDAAAGASLAVTAVLAVPLFQHRLIHSVGLASSGVTVAVVTPYAAVAAAAPLLPIVLAAAVFWRHRAQTGERYLAASAAAFAAGFVVGGVLQVPFPVLSMTNAVSVLLVGYAIVRRQLMNPLRELTEDLERKVAERSRQLEDAYREVEKRVEERTAQLQREIAERRNAEEVLRESEEKFRNLAEQSPNMIFINAGGRVVYANRRCEEVMGYSRAEFYSPRFDFFVLIAPESLDVVRNAYARHTQDQEVPPYEYALLTKEGRRIEVLNASKVIRYGGQAAILGVIAEIGARKRTERLLAGLNEVALGMTRAMTPEEGLEQATGRLASLGFFACVYLVSDERGSLELRSYAGQSSEDPPYKPAAELALTSRTLAVRIMEEKRALAVAADEVPELSPPRMGGVVLAPLVVEHEAVGLLSVASPDISDEDVPTVTAYANLVAASWRKTRLMKELGESLEQLQRTQAQLVQSQKMEAIGRLAGGLAHDFNNVLTAITGYADLAIGSGGLDPELREDLSEIRRAAGRASALTRQLLTFGRKQPLQPKTVDLNAIVLGMDKMLRRLIPEDIDLRTALADGLGSVRADPGQVEQVILNLAVNARDAMPEGGRLTIETANVELDELYTRRYPGVRPASYVMLAVTDTGVGMDAETQQHLFEPFFTTKLPGTGTGLGLSTVYGIVKQSGGHVSVYSEPGRGSTFKVYLPKVVAAVADEGGGQAEPAAVAGSETVLVVEDEPVLRNLVRRILARSGYDVLTASNADEAIRVADAHPSAIHLMVTDVVMPGAMNGRDLGALPLRPQAADARALHVGLRRERHRPPGHPRPRRGVPAQALQPLQPDRQGARRPGSAPAELIRSRAAPVLVRLPADRIVSVRRRRPGRGARRH